MSLPTVAQRAVLARLYLNNQTQSNYPVCRRHATLSAPSDEGIISENRSVGKGGASDDRGVVIDRGKKHDKRPREVALGLESWEAYWKTIRPPSKVNVWQDGLEAVG